VAVFLIISLETIFKSFNMLMTFGGDSLSQISDSDVISLMTSFAKNGCVTFDTTTLRGTTFLMEQHTFKNVNNH
jgi:hypothetical protein